jgi:hypothetical protein
MLRAPKGGAWTSNFSNGFMNKMTHHVQSVTASNDIRSMNLLGTISSKAVDTNKVSYVNDKITGDFFFICGVSVCGGPDKGGV